MADWVAFVDISCQRTTRNAMAKQNGQTIAGGSETTVDRRTAVQIRVTALV